MIDVKIDNMDIETDSTGAFKRLSGIDALFQRAFMCISAKKGAFVYNRKLGTDISGIDLTATDAKDRLELVFNEAVADYDNTAVGVIEIGEKVRINVIIGEESREMEVDVH